MSSPILCIGKYSFYSKKKQKKYRPLYGSEGPTMENCTVAVLHAMSCRCSGTLSRRVSKQGSELLGACRAHRPLADAHVLHAKSSPALAPQFIACNTPTQFITLRAISIARNDCTQETARSRWRDAGKDQIGPKNWENAIEGPSLPCNFTPMGLPTHLAPYRSQERCRRMRREFLRAVLVKVTHHVERRKQRIIVLPRTEDENPKDDRRHAPHACIPVDDLAEIVRSRLGDDRFGLGNQGFQTFPAERALDSGDLVFVLRLGGEHGLGHAEQGSRHASRVLARSTTLS